MSLSDYSKILVEMIDNYNKYNSLVIKMINECKIKLNYTDIKDIDLLIMLNK